MTTPERRPAGTCTACGAETTRLAQPHVLLPAGDVPRSGSRTEIVVSPAGCLRVWVRVCGAGHVQLERVDDRVDGEG